MERIHCRECNELISSTAQFCPKCGANQIHVVQYDSDNSAFTNKNESTNQKPNIGLNIISFLFPFIGLILFICYNDDAPIRAKACGKWALFGVIVETVLTIVSLIIFFGIIGFVSGFSE
ncbi:MAG: zinc ribbon domain-containing protein [Bacteroidales bacterium]|nr:zinc ribbon domain-containing protein [Candidatus Colimorpha onthohippi]